jgi:hypothetical protein
LKRSRKPQAALAAAAVCVVPETTEAITEMNEGVQQTPQFVNDLASAWGDFVVNGFRDFQGFVRNVLNSFKRMLSSMVADAVRARIMQALGAGGGMAAGPAMASGGGGMGGVGGLLGSLLPAAGTATGFAGGLGNAMGGSIFNVANNAAAAGGGLMATMGARCRLRDLSLAASWQSDRRKRRAFSAAWPRSCAK